MGVSERDVSDELFLSSVRDENKASVRQPSRVVKIIGALFESPRHIAAQ